MPRPTVFAVVVTLCALRCGGGSSRPESPSGGPDRAPLVESTPSTGPLPPQVEATRHSIITAVRAEDWRTLDSLAGWTPEPGHSPFLYTYGPILGTPSEFWQHYAGAGTLERMEAKPSHGCLIPGTQSSGSRRWAFRHRNQTIITLDLLTQMFPHTILRFGFGTLAVSATWTAAVDH